MNDYLDDEFKDYLNGFDTDDIEENEPKNTVILTGDNGEEFEFEIVDTVEFKNEQFVILYPIDDDDENLLILKVENKNRYVGVDSEETLNNVFEIFKERFKDNDGFIFEE